MTLQGAVMAAVLEAVSSIASGIDRLLEMANATDLAALGPDDLIAAMRAFEAQRNRLSVVDHGFVEAAEMESLWERTTARGTAGALAQILRLPKSEANARVRGAKWFAPRLTLDGQELPPALPLASAAQRDGAVSAAQASVIGHCIDELACNPRLDIGEVRAAEDYLVEHASAFGPRELQRIATKIVDTLIPDGTPPRDALVNARRGLTIGPQRRDGTATVSGVLTPEVRATLWAVLSPLSAPRPEAHGERDTRSPKQRMHDALGEACARLLSSDELPSSGGVPATVVVTTTLEELQTAASRMTGAETSCDQKSLSFTTVDGTTLSLAQLLRLADQAEIVPTFLDSAGGVVAYGRSRRAASPGQMRALIARDGGCSFPDCDIPPQWCEAHHVVPWVAGGTTDLWNLALACKYHHRHFEERDWECVMIDQVPHWIPPPWVDPHRKPLRNLRALKLSHALVDRTSPPDSELSDPERAHQETIVLQPVYEAESPKAPGAVACAVSVQRPAAVSAVLPKKPKRVENALDVAYDAELVSAVNEAVASWVECALSTATENAAADPWGTATCRTGFSLELACTA